MPLKVIDDMKDNDEFSLGPSEDGTYTQANGGTEMMDRALKERVDNDLLEQFYIIKSRVRWVDPKRPNILWLHDTWDDPEDDDLPLQKTRNVDYRRTETDEEGNVTVIDHSSEAQIVQDICAAVWPTE